MISKLGLEHNIDRSVAHSAKQSDKQSKAAKSLSKYTPSASSCESQTISYSLGDSSNQQDSNSSSS